MGRGFNWFWMALVVSMGCVWIACGGKKAETPPPPLQVLVFSKTNSFRHSCIGIGSEAIHSYFESKGIHTTLTEDSLMFTDEKLKAFDAVLFFQTTGIVLGGAERNAFQNYYKNGKGFVGIHGAADAEYDWPWYSDLIGARFADHPQIQSASVVRTDTVHVATALLPQRWQRTDEWYNFKSVPQGVSVLLKLDETTYEGGSQNGDHPIAWCRDFDGGRTFYTGLGHTEESYSDTLYLEHLHQAVLWVTHHEK